jgi:hypothetical protein
MPTATLGIWIYAEGHVYAEGTRVSVAADLPRGATPTVALDVDYADDLLRLAEGSGMSA